MKAILFAALIFATASANGTANRMSGSSCTRFKCTADNVTFGEMVNRNGKGDRLSMAQVLHSTPAKQPAKVEGLSALARDQRLADGCESLASSLSHSSAANIAGRCLS